MADQELVFLVAVTVIMPIAVLWIILNYQKARLKAKEFRADNSLTTSELNSIIDESVAAATEPLDERIRDLERQLRLIDSGPGGTIQDELEQTKAEVAEAPSKTLGRTRS
jgi:hypothetical protein